MKQLIKSVFTAIGAMTTLLLIMGGIYLALNRYNMIPEALTNLRRDPIYQQQLSGDEPQLVHQTKVGDDAVPFIYQTYYNPRTDSYTDFIIEVER